MRRLFRFTDWPLRAKLAALLGVASVVPLGFAAFRDIHDMRERQLASTAALLAARGDHLAEALDSFHRINRIAAERFTRLPLVSQYCRAAPADAERMKPLIRNVFVAHMETDEAVRGGAILDPFGVIRVASDEALAGK